MLHGINTALQRQCFGGTLSVWVPGSHKLIKRRQEPGWGEQTSSSPPSPPIPVLAFLSGSVGK